MTDTELDSLVARMRALGITRYRNGDVEIDLGDEPPTQAATPDGKRRKQSAAEQARAAEAAAQAEEDRKQRILFASSSVRPVFPKD